jgi:hypothetical protein
LVFLETFPLGKAPLVFLGLFSSPTAPLEGDGGFVKHSCHLYSALSADRFVFLGCD